MERGVAFRKNNERLSITKTAKIILIYGLQSNKIWYYDTINS